MTISELIPGKSEVEALLVPRDGNFYIRAAGVTHFQSTLTGIAKGVQDRNVSFNALVVRDHGNLHSNKALAVYRVSQRRPAETTLIGYLPDGDARQYSKILEEFQLEGLYVLGYTAYWDAKSMYYVRLDIPLPYQLKDWIESYD